MAFKIAGSMAFKEAARKADPVLLEPIMAVEVTTPEEYMGDVIGDLTSRRGRIEDMEERGGSRSSARWCRWRRCSATPPTCGRATQGRADVHHAVRLLQRGARRRSRKEIIARVTRRVARPAQTVRAEAQEDVRWRKAEVRADQAARQHRHDRSHRPRQDDADGGDHQACWPTRASADVHAVRPDRQGAGGARARHHDRHRPRRVRDRRTGTTPTSTARATPTTSRT